MINEIEGWNYDNANPKGRNVFIFRDTCHASPIIQDKLIEAMEGSISRKLFYLLFTEGLDKEYNSPFNTLMPESWLKKSNKKQTGRYGAVEIIAHRLKKINNHSVKIYGMDSEQLQKEHLACFKQILNARNKTGAGIATDFEKLQGILAITRSDQLTDARTRYSVKTISETMINWNVNTAGAIYGEGHYKLFTKELVKQGFGYVSYYPGRVELEQQDYEAYLEMLVK